ncbi:MULTISPECIES: alkaline phosphatase PafA [Polaribacter]|uniref:Alkaline phosphatase family protein n=1 Tax=Polaribacter sejongensis TaxID=985043 RepID=A0AAJ1QW54_9FLAO|nr:MULTISPECIES: alkaline phosphatase PafA [Polaribacter]MDN3619240.1 alkaline phosphatase family protein [Polaribacter undariae]UWD33559.1 alkaline phosphatase family protein [Polaribacter undariae]
MKFKLLFSFICLFIYLGNNKLTSQNKKPKLVVGIVIDQMRYDYLTRYSDRYGKDGFNRILQEGFSLENAHYNYIPTYTAVGHTSIYTGTTPSEHGIISNNWYDKYQKESIYCVDDNNYKTVGNEGKYGQKSPKRLFTSTITDQLHLAQNMFGKTIGVSIKDRSAILPAGHSANAAYWYDGGNFNTWITSTYYMNELPKWVKDFNGNNNADKYLNTPWETLYDIETYTNSRVDDNIYEGKLKGQEAPTFPKDLKALRSKNGNFDLIKTVPAGNTYTTDFAKAAIIGENLGKGEHTDFLAVSYSSTDYIGHKYGVAAIETEDTYLRLDKDLANLFQFLDQQVGKDNYTLFLTADHAAVHVPAYLQSLKIPAHYLKMTKFKEFILETTKKYFNSVDLIENVSNYQIFLDKDKVESLGLEVNNVAQKLADEVINFDGIYKAVTARTLQTTHFSSGILNSLQNGYNQKLSGDVLMIPNPATLTGGRTGTSHGSGYSYDTHVPIIFYGNGIKQGSSSKRYNITDIAPTIANLLNIESPNGTNGVVVDEVLEK